MTATPARQTHARAPLDSASTDRSSIDELDAAICKLARRMNADTYRLLMLVREFDDRFGWAKWSFRSCAEWLAWRCGLSLSAARERVRTAQALREMPAISAAFADGRLSYSKVRALSRVVQWHDEDRLLAYALQTTAAQVEERCREIRNASPDESVGGAWRAWERRGLTISRSASRGVMTITVDVPIEDGEVIAQAIERAAEAGESATGLEFAAARSSSRSRDFVAERSASADGGAPNGWRAQQADALVTVARAYLGSNGMDHDGGDRNGADHNDGDCNGADHNGGDRKAGIQSCRSVHASKRTTSAADRYQVIVHVDDSALHGGIGRSDLPIETVKRLTCDGRLITVVEDDGGRPLDVGRKRRTVSTSLKRALWSRDRHCSFPGCHNVRYVDAHHIHHWAEGGETSLRNLTLLCSYHHRLLHEGGFGIRRGEDGAIHFQRADGRVIPRHGYRLEDVCDDDGEGDPSAEVRREFVESLADLSAEVRRRLGEGAADPSAEVREPAGVYGILTRSRLSA
jgi:hypothetical protein